jgi:hypothetical protein
VNPIEAVKLARTYRAARPFIALLQKESMKNAVFSWKTTAGGVIGIATVVASHFGYLTMDQAAAIFTLAASLGLIAAKDSNVTGGTKEQ